MGYTSDWQQPYTFTNLELIQGTNILGIAAWDRERIAAMSGQFKMPDGTDFGSSNVEDWLVFNADKDPTACTGNGCTGFDNKAKNPLELYKEVLRVWTYATYK